MSLNSPNINSGPFPRPSSITTLPNSREASQQSLPATSQARPNIPVSAPARNSPNHFLSHQPPHGNVPNMSNATQVPQRFTLPENASARLRAIDLILRNIHDQSRGLPISGDTLITQQRYMQERQHLLSQAQAGPHPGQSNGSQNISFIQYQPAPQAQHGQRGQPMPLNHSHAFASNPQLRNWAVDQFPSHFPESLPAADHSARSPNLTYPPPVRSNGFPPVAPHNRQPSNAQPGHQLQNGTSPVTQNGYQQGPPSGFVNPTNGRVPSPMAMPVQPMEYEEAYEHLHVRDRPLIPPVGVFHKAAAPNPSRTALHQAHVTSPVLVPRDLPAPGPESK